MELQVGVKILLKNSEGKFLFLKRSKEKYPEVKDPWDIVGGRINVGSALMENLEREVKEETGIVLQGSPRLVAAQDILVPIKNRHVIRLTYIGETNDEPVLDADHDDYKWMTKEEALELGDGFDKYVRELFEMEIL